MVLTRTEVHDSNLLRALERRTAAPRRLCVLEGFEVRLERDAVTLPMGVQRLLAFLALQPRPVLREYVAGALWTDSTEEHANANLRSALWRARRLAGRVIASSRSHVSLAPDVAVDIRESRARARRVINPSVAWAPEDLSIRPFTGDLLPDWYDEWVIVERERFRQLRLSALEALCWRLTDLNYFGRAIEAGLAAVVAEPLRESAHRVLMTAYVAEGNPADAIRQYARYQRTLFDELGMDPSRDMTTFVHSLTA